MEYWLAMGSRDGVLSWHGQWRWYSDWTSQLAMSCQYTISTFHAWSEYHISCLFPVSTPSSVSTPCIYSPCPVKIPLLFMSSQNTTPAHVPPYPQPMSPSDSTPDNTPSLQHMPNQYLISTVHIHYLPYLPRMSRKYPFLQSMSRQYPSLYPTSRLSPIATAYAHV